MTERLSSCRGCLLGLAVGDAMGHIVDEKTFSQICEDYGPNGLLGYDLVNGQAEGSAYTQVAAYVANGLLLGITRGKPEQYLRFAGVSLREWARAQNFPRDPERSYCWVAKLPQMRKKKYKDSRMLDALRAQELGSVDQPINRSNAPGSLAGAAMAGLAWDDKYLKREYVSALAARITALTHGGERAFLTGAVLAECIAALLENKEQDLYQVFDQVIHTVQCRFEIKFSQMAQVAGVLRRAMSLAKQDGNGQQDMERLNCDSADECLSGAMYACLKSGGDFDSAMILAVNHSGRSAAVGALTGALLGTALGAEALPEFYLESLQAAPILEQLAADLAQGSPTTGLFDDDWDHKYVQGLPVHLDQ